MCTLNAIITAITHLGGNKSESAENDKEKWKGRVKQQSGINIKVKRGGGAKDRALRSNKLGFRHKFSQSAVWPDFSHFGCFQQSHMITGIMYKFANKYFIQRQCVNMRKHCVN